MFDTILSKRFEKHPGHKKVQSKEYVIEDGLSGRELDRMLELVSCLRPGQKIEMCITFSDGNIESNTCPRCQTESIGSTESREWYVQKALLILECKALWLTIQAVEIRRARCGFSEFSKRMKKSLNSSPLSQTCILQLRTSYRQPTILTLAQLHILYTHETSTESGSSESLRLIVAKSAENELHGTFTISLDNLPLLITQATPRYANSVRIYPSNIHQSLDD